MVLTKILSPGLNGDEHLKVSSFVKNALTVLAENLNLSEYITVAELSACCGNFKLLTEIRSRQERIIKHCEFFCKSKQRENAEHRTRSDFQYRQVEARKNLKKLEIQLTKTMGGLLDIPHTTNNVCSIRQSFKELGSAEEQYVKIFGTSVTDKRAPAVEPVIIDTLEKLHQETLVARKSEWRWRLIEELTLREKQGWYIFFNTLTVDNKNYNDVFSKGSRAFSEYIRSVERSCYKSMFKTWRDAQKVRVSDPWHTYFCVTERGAKTGRLHLHVIHCIREIPEKWKVDPNQGLNVPIRRNSIAFGKCWSHGYSNCIAVRFSSSDAWAKNNWRWPVKKVENQYVPITGKPPAAVGNYMIKYLQKEVSGENLWRIKVNCSFGMTRMKKVISELGTEVLTDLLKLQKPMIKIRDYPIPRNILRRLMLKELTGRLKNGETGSRKSIIMNSLIRVKARLPLVERLRSLMKKKPEFNSPNSGPIRQVISMSTEGSEAAACRLAHKMLQLRVNIEFSDPFTRYGAHKGTCHERQ